MIRTFIAVEVSAAVKQRASDMIEKCVRMGVDAKWVAVENMHITLQFLGNVRETELASIFRSLQKAVAPLPPFDVICRGVGAFPSPDRPRTIWIGMEQGREELIQLQAAVEGSLKHLGFRGENRRFEPHLTIGRVRAEASGSEELADFIRQQSDYEGSVFDVDEVLVFSSQLLKGGPKYEVIGRAEMNG